jgi:hypothetical protein
MEMGNSSDMPHKTGESRSTLWWFVRMLLLPVFLVINVLWDLLLLPLFIGASVARGFRRNESPDR